MYTKIGPDLFLYFLFKRKKPSKLDVKSNIIKLPTTTTTTNRRWFSRNITTKWEMSLMNISRVFQVEARAISPLLIWPCVKNFHSIHLLLYKTRMRELVSKFILKHAHSAICGKWNLIHDQIIWKAFIAIDKTSKRYQFQLAMNWSIRTLTYTYINTKKNRISGIRVHDRLTTLQIHSEHCHCIQWEAY